MQRPTSPPSGSGRSVSSAAQAPADPYLVQPVSKALAVLAIVEDAGQEVGLSDVARALGLPKTSAFRYLYTLAAAGFVAYGSSRDRYRAGPRLHRGRESEIDVARLREFALPAMSTLRARFNETINLGVPDRDRVVYVEMIESSRALRMQARIGERHPLNSTSLGKAILAFMSEAERAPLLGAPLKAMTARTTVDPLQLRRQLREIARRGYAIETGENEEGLMCIGVPILERGGRPVAALSLSAPEARMTRPTRMDVITALRAAASGVSRRLGYRGGLPASASTGAQGAGGRGLKESGI
jgi:IclR family acetate operon transcriptional repressor